jgi:GMP synthase-like glutamine amidotransferase
MNILVFQHLVTEHPGSFRDVMREEGHVMHAVQLGEGEAIPPLDEYDALLVMGGPMDVWEVEQHPWLLDEMAAIRAWVAAKKPYLGICLGSQLLAQACGGHVQLMETPECGISHVSVEPHAIFNDVPNLCPCFQWHGAEVVRLPPGARQLATSPGCRIQAFTLGEHAYGLQFHLELTATSATEWGERPAYVAALEKIRGPGILPAVQAEVAAHFDPLYAAATSIFRNFTRIAAGA